MPRFEDVQIVDLLCFNPLCYFFCSIQGSAQEERNPVTSLLTESDKKILEPFALQFKEYAIYDISILRKLLKQIEDAENENIKNWKEEMSKAIRTGNEEWYKELIDETLKKYM